MRAQLLASSFFVSWFVCVLGRAAAAPAPLQTTVSVLYFDNDSGDKSLDYLGKGLADMMITDLSGAPGLVVVEREKLEALLKELKLERSRYFDPKTTQRIGKGLGAELAVAGSFVAVSPDLRLDVRVVRIDSGKVLKSVQVTGKKDQFFDLYKKLVGQLVDGLGAALSKADAGHVIAAADRNRAVQLGAALDYSKGIDLRDRGDLKGASQQLQNVMRDAPGFALAKSRYMQVMKELYAAKETRGKLLTQSEEQLLAAIDKHLGAQVGNRDGSYFAYRSLRSELYLRKLAQSLTGPSTAYLPYLRAYRDNQEKLIAELVENDRRTEIDYNPEISLKSLDSEDLTLAMHLQLPLPSPPTSTRAMKELVALLMFGESSVEEIKLSKTYCFFKLDATFAPASFKLLDRIIERAAQKGAQYRKKLQENHQPVAWADDEQAARIVEMLQWYALALLSMGQREEALSKLQTALTKYPKSTQFEITEQMLRAIASGEDKMPDGIPLNECVNPK